MAPVNAMSRPEFHLRVVKEVGDIINNSDGLSLALQAVAEHLAASMQFDVVSIYLWDEKSDELVQSANHGLQYDNAKPIRLKSEEGLTGLVFRERKPLMAVPASAHPSYKYFPDSGEWRFESYLGVPIMLRRQCLGVLVAQLSDERAFQKGCDTLFEIIAHRLAGVLEVAGRIGNLTNSSRDERGTYKQATGVSQGIAFGPAHILDGLIKEFDTSVLSHHGLEKERFRLAMAREKVEKEMAQLVRYLEADGKLSAVEVGIFKAQQILLQDIELAQAVDNRLVDGRSAEFAVQKGVNDLYERFGATAPAFFKERLNDLLDLGEKLLVVLLDERGTEVGSRAFVPGAVLIAHEIGPARLMAYAKQGNVGGIVAEIGGEGGHMAILARSLGIPAVTGVKVADFARESDRMLVDGRTGFVFVNPPEVVVKEYEAYRSKQNELRKHLQEDGQNLKGCPFNVRVTANIGFPGDIAAARRAHIDDVGLLRTEFSFMQCATWPTVEEQARLYEEVAKEFDGYLTIRTLDIGSDKQLPYFEMPREENPMLGLRSIRFSMENMDGFQDQVTAILQTMQHGYPVRIMLPMVTQLWELDTAREILVSTCNSMGLHPNERPALGMMVEVPGVIYQLHDFLERVDFVSLGTNDLIQYLLTVDRNSAQVSHLYCEHHPIVIRFLDDLFQRVRVENKDITVCGEMGGNPLGLLILLALGYRKLSVLPERAFLVRALCKRLTERQLADIRFAILKESRPGDIQAYLNKQLESIYPELLQMD